MHAAITQLFRLYDLSLSSLILPQWVEEVLEVNGIEKLGQLVARLQQEGRCLARRPDRGGLDGFGPKALEIVIKALEDADFIIELRADGATITPPEWLREGS